MNNEKSFMNLKRCLINERQWRDQGAVAHRHRSGSLQDELGLFGAEFEVGAVAQVVVVLGLGEDDVGEQQDLRRGEGQRCG